MWILKSKQCFIPGQLSQSTVQAKVADGKLVKVPLEGPAVLPWPTRTGVHYKHVKRALYVPDLETDLASVSEMEDSGYKLIFSKSARCIVTPDGDIIDMIRNRNLPWVVTCNRSRAQPGAAERVHAVNLKPAHAEPYRLWHDRLHRPDRVMKGLPSVTEGVEYSPSSMPDTNPCDPCLRGGHKRRGLPKQAASRATEPLESVSTDHWGPFPVPAICTGNTYMQGFLDSYSSEGKLYGSKQRTASIAAKNFMAYVAEVGTPVHAVDCEETTHR